MVSEAERSRIHDPDETSLDDAVSFALLFYFGSRATRLSAVVLPCGPPRARRAGAVAFPASAGSATPRRDPGPYRYGPGDEHPGRRLLRGPPSPLKRRRIGAAPGPASPSG